MKNQLLHRALVLAKKEIYQYLYAPSTYGITVFFLLFSSIWTFYIQRFFVMDMAALRVYFAAFPIIYIIVIPVITMKSWAEERKTGTIELLVTMPFTEWDLVLGKFFASFVVIAAMLVFTIPVPLTLMRLGNFDIGTIFCEYLGSLLLGASAAALGLLLSSLAKSQAGSFLGSAVVLMAVMLSNNLAFALNLPFALSRFINFFSLSFHFESFSKGILDSRDLAFFVLSTALFLFLNTRVIIFRKWK